MNKLIIFDLDNTFYEYDHAHNSALKSIFINQNKFPSYPEFEIGYEDAKNIIHKNLGNNPSKHSKLIYFKEMFSSSLSTLDILNLDRIYWESFINSSVIDKNTINILTSKKTPGDAYFLFTNQNLHTQLNKITKWSIDIFDTILTSEEVGFEKPHKNFYKFVENAFTEFSDPSYSMFAIGDSYVNDIEYWINNYDAKAYLINNKEENYKDSKRFIETNFTQAVKDIFS